MKQDIFRRIAKLVEEGKTFAIATVVWVEGSAPAGPGSRMVVMPDGIQYGTIGGAALEEESKALALKAIKRGAGAGGLFDFDLGGTAEKSVAACGGRAKVFIEVVKPKPHILIFGGGHIGLEVARLCDFLEYSYSVVDDRAEFASVERFPNAVGLFNQTVGEFAGAADMKQYSHVLICTYAHEHDAEVAGFVLKNFHSYIGLVGSKAKRAEIRGKLGERGIPGERFDEVHCPVGMNIGAKTPAEIALSIMAEIIADTKTK